jgi:hypothetical protein
VVPAAYSSFLVASTQASAALIGLLFVAVSIAPERVFGPGAQSTRKAMALSSFTAMANVFFVSFGSLIPDLAFGTIVVAAGIVAASQTLSLLSLVGSWRAEGSQLRGIALFAISGGIYAFEIVIGLQLLYGTPDKALFTELETLMLGIFSIGLARAWELLGAPHSRSAIGMLTGWLVRSKGSGDKPEEGGGKGSTS